MHAIDTSNLSVHRAEIKNRVAMSRNSNGKFKVWLTDSGKLIARAFHDKNNRLSSQVFDLVCHGLLKSASISFADRQIISSPRYDYGGYGEPETVACVMQEWSYVDAPANPDCVLHAMDIANTALSRNRLDDSVIHPRLKSYLQGVIAQPMPPKPEDVALKRLEEAYQMRIDFLERQLLDERQVHADELRNIHTLIQALADSNRVIDLQIKNDPMQITVRQEPSTINVQVPKHPTPIVNVTVEQPAKHPMSAKIVRDTDGKMIAIESAA